MWLNVAIASRGRCCNKQSGTTSSWNNAAIVSRSEWDGEAGRDNVFTIGLWWESLDRPWHNGLCSTGDQGGSANRPGTPPGSGTSTDAEKVGLRGTQGDEGPRWHSIAGAKTAKWQRFPAVYEHDRVSFTPSGLFQVQVTSKQLDRDWKEARKQGVLRVSAGFNMVNLRLLLRSFHTQNIQQKAPIVLSGGFFTAAFCFCDFHNDS